MTRLKKIRGGVCCFEGVQYHVIMPDLGYLLQLAKRLKAWLWSVSKNHVVYIQNLKSLLNLQVVGLGITSGQGHLVHPGVPAPCTNQATETHRCVADGTPTCRKKSYPVVPVHLGLTHMARWSRALVLSWGDITPSWTCGKVWSQFWLF